MLADHRPKVVRQLCIDVFDDCLDLLGRGLAATHPGLDPGCALLGHVLVQVGPPGLARGFVPLPGMGDQEAFRAHEPLWPAGMAGRVASLLALVELELKPEVRLTVNGLLANGHDLVLELRPSEGVVGLYVAPTAGPWDVVTRLGGWRLAIVAH